MTSLYSVECIVGKRRNHKKNQDQYKVKWKGYPESQATWEPIKNLKTVQEMISDYEEQLAMKKEEARPKSQKIKPNREEISSIFTEEEENPYQMKSKEREKEISHKKKNYQKDQFEAKRIELEPKNYKRLMIDESDNKKPIRKRVKAQETIQDSPVQEDDISEEKLKNIMQKIIKATETNSLESDIKIIDISKDEEGQFIYLVEDSSGLKSYKARSYMLENYSEQLIGFYESKIQFVRVKKIDNEF